MTKHEVCSPVTAVAGMVSLRLSAAFFSIAVLVGTPVLIGVAAAQQTTTYAYDTLGRLIQVDHPGTAERSYEYDDAGNRIEMDGGGSGGANQPPVTSPDSVIISSVGMGEIVNLVANDTDPNGDTLEVLSVSIPSGPGAVASYLIAPDKQHVTFVGHNVGTVLFSYEVSDGNGGTATGLGNVQVLSGDCPPFEICDE